jgi:EAL domain
LKLQALGFTVVADGFGDGRPSSSSGSAGESEGVPTDDGRDDARGSAHGGESAVGGSASLAHLGQLPVKAVCLDRSIVERASHSAGPRLVVESTARVAATLGMVTLADGVGSAHQGLELAQLGCQFGVGEGCGPWLEQADWQRRHAARVVVGST